MSLEDQHPLPIHRQFGEHKNMKAIEMLCLANTKQVIYTHILIASSYITTYQTSDSTSKNLQIYHYIDSNGNHYEYIGSLKKLISSTPSMFVPECLKP